MPLWLLLATPPALACPFCATETGRQVNAGIFGPDFASTALMVLAPFPALLAAVVGLLVLLPLRAEEVP